MNDAEIMERAERLLRSFNAALCVPARPNTRTDPARSRRRHLVAIAVLVGMAAGIGAGLVSWRSGRRNAASEGRR